MRFPSDATSHLDFQKFKAKAATYTRTTDKSDKDSRFDPFSPPNPELFAFSVGISLSLQSYYRTVTKLYNTHYVVMNKFMVAPHHLVMPTVSTEHQDVSLHPRCNTFSSLYLFQNHLTVNDIRTAVYLLSELGGLIWFNCGPLSGARFVLSLSPFYYSIPTCFFAL